GPTGGPTTYRELPAELRSKLPRAPMNKAEGSWPEYSRAVARTARERNVPLPGKLWPCHPQDFPLPVQVPQFIERKLDEKDRAQLKEVEGKWPEYPELLARLAREKKLPVPGTYLPGSRPFWEGMRTALPEVPDETLRRFALMELTEEERQRLGLSISDP